MSMRQIQSEMMAVQVIFCTHEQLNNFCITSNLTVIVQVAKSFQISADKCFGNFYKNSYAGIVNNGM